MSYLRKGDTVIAKSGKDKGKIGKILKVLSVNNKSKAIVEGINLASKHKRRRKQDEPAGILKIEMPIDISNILIYCSKCKRGVRVSIDKSQEGKKARLCKKCQAVL
ncbi:MAG: 50S ribosomal protein L24 [Candidatus Omnitrophota bacterium]